MDDLLCTAYENGADSSPPLLCGPPANRKRRARTQFDYYAIQRMEAVFQVNPYPDIVLRETLADEIGVSEARVQTWFQNKRSRTKRTLRRTSDPTELDSADVTPTGKSPDKDSSASQVSRPKKKRASAAAPGDAVSLHKRSSFPTAQRNTAASSRSNPGFRPFYREFLSSSSTSTAAAPTDFSTALNVNTGYPRPAMPVPWMPYAWIGQQHMPSYHLPPFFAMPPSWTMTSPTAALSSEQLLLTAAPRSHNRRPHCGTDSPDSTIPGGPKATSTPVNSNKQISIFPQKHVEEAPSSDSDGESTEKVDTVQDSGYTSGKSDSEDQIDVCS